MVVDPNIQLLRLSRDSSRVIEQSREEVGMGITDAVGRGAIKGVLWWCFFRVVVKGCEGKDLNTLGTIG